MIHIQFAELPAFDQDRAVLFWTTHLGCTVVSDEVMGPEGWRWIELALPGARTRLHLLPRADDRPSEQPVLVLVDDDLHTTVAALRARGVEIVDEPAESPWEPGRMTASFRDSEGNLLMLSGA